AAQGMGMRSWEVLLKVELPLALPLVFAGIRTSALFVIATSPLAGFVGGGTLGDIIANQASYRLSGVIGAAICVAALAILVELSFAGLQRLVTPRGLRRTDRGDARTLSTLDPLAEPV
ncbi:MAG: osmoprotectant transport system permease protein, partial [Gaiellaceae bacterium]|nr:osmoprotectant transport system permease protein [Gaiellaceae bacterium]